MRNEIDSAADAERLAKRRIPKSLFESIHDGAAEEITAQRNIDAYRSVSFRPRVAVQHDRYDLRTTVLGHEISFPVMIAPTGNLRMYHISGEPAVARAAGRAGTIQMVSCFTGYPIEDIVHAGSGPIFFDLYMAGGRENAEVMLTRAQKAGCSALVITVDVPGGLPGDRTTGPRAYKPVGLNWSTAVKFAPQLIPHPAWTVDFIRSGMHLDCPMWIKPDGRAASFGEMKASVLRRYATWTDLPWIREIWDGPIIIKGLLCAEDARRAVDEGADGIIVSNHGGRALDGSLATLRVIGEVVESVRGETEVYMDGGIRRGTDVVKALALGARAVLIGRPSVYAHAAAGGDGVYQMLDYLRRGVESTLRSLGCPSVRDLNRSYISLPSKWNDAD